MVRGLFCLSLIYGAVLLSEFFVEPVAAAFVLACVADRPLEAEPAAREPAPESEEESVDTLSTTGP